jgi:hypothetical protein
VITVFWKQVKLPVQAWLASQGRGNADGKEEMWIIP